MLKDFGLPLWGPRSLFGGFFFSKLTQKKDDKCPQSELHKTDK